MLYQKNRKKSLSHELFQNPSCEYRGAPFWAWNTRLSDDMLLEQIDTFQEMGIGGFHMHVRTGMETPYLNEEFMHFVSLCNEKAKKEGMLCWLYDEDRWPSGAGGGFVTKNYRFRQKSFCLSPEDPRGGDCFAASREEYLSMTEGGGKCAGYFVSRYGVRLDGEGFLTHYKRLDEKETYDGDLWYGYVHIEEDNAWFNGQAYLDTMKKEAVEAFIRTTHEAYAKAVGKDFGKSIPALFTDEPQVHCRKTLAHSEAKEKISLPFTDDLEESYLARYGESLLDKIPELFWEKTEEGCALTRYRFSDHLCERFVSAFADTVGDWCEKHGLALTGHVMQEPTLRSQTDSVGEAMRCYRSFHIPGMDLLCDGMEYTTAKQVQSAVHQYGREAMLSELYGVTGWDFPFRGHKRQGDWQAALGVTVRVHHLTWVSMLGEAKRDFPASIGYQSPWYKEYRFIEDHFARLYTALTRGKPDVRVGVIHPVESFWLHTGPEDKTAEKKRTLDREFQSLTTALVTGGVDFDFISESLLPSLCAESSNPLQVGKMQYDCIVVPPLETVRSTTLARLSSFAAKGGTVILLGEPPRRVDALPDEAAKRAAEGWTRLPFDFKALTEALAPFRFVSFEDGKTGVPTDNILHQLRKDGTERWLFFCHGRDVAKKKEYSLAFSREEVRLRFKGAFDVTEYDTLTGAIFTPAYEIKNGQTVLEYTLFGEDSHLLRLTPCEGEKRVEGTAPSRPMPLSERGGLTLGEPASYTLHEPNALLLDRAQYAFDGEPYAEKAEDSIRICGLGRARFYQKHRWQTVFQPWVPVPEELKNDKGHLLRRKFTFRTDIPLENTFLALELAEEARIFLNGTEIKKTVDGWYVDKCIRTVPLPRMDKGQVTIEVETPFTLRSRSEWCYLLGDFGVRVEGPRVTATERKKALSFTDLTAQTLPFYTGNITYHLCFFEAEGARRTLQLPAFGGAAARVRLDGADRGLVALSPFCLDLGEVSPGEHCLEITLYGTRYNGFGPLHNNEKEGYFQGPEAWWHYDTPLRTDAYRLHPTGLLEAPIVY